MVGLELKLELELGLKLVGLKLVRLRFGLMDWQFLLQPFFPHGQGGPHEAGPQHGDGTQSFHGVQMIGFGLATATAFTLKSHIFKV